jgi:hypothetical protein
MDFSRFWHLGGSTFLDFGIRVGRFFRILVFGWVGILRLLVFGWVGISRFLVFGWVGILRPRWHTPVSKYGSDPPGVCACVYMCTRACERACVKCVSVRACVRAYTCVVTSVTL